MIRRYRQILPCPPRTEDRSATNVRVCTTGPCPRRGFPAACFGFMKFSKFLRQRRRSWYGPPKPPEDSWEPPHKHTFSRRLTHDFGGTMNNRSTIKRLAASVAAGGVVAFAPVAMPA